MIEFGVDKYTSLDQFKLSCDDSLDPKNYNYNSMVFEFNIGIDILWDLYLLSNPRNAWSGDSIRFDFAYSKPNNKVYYSDEQYLPKVHVGMGFYIVLKIAHMMKLPVGLEVSKIDPIGKTFEYTYLAANVSQGRQTIHFIDLGNHRTRIEHTTYFKSSSKFRDRIYPVFHETLLQEFHENVTRLMGIKAVRIQ